MRGANPRRDGRAQHGSARPEHHGPHRAPRAGEVAAATVVPDPDAQLVLSLMRWHFQTFASPDSQGWLMAMRVASAHVGPDRAGRLCYDIVALIQTLRCARQTTFAFNGEACACCRVWLTPDERRVMELLDALRAGQVGRARAITQMLCDGICNEDLLLCAERFVQRHLGKAIASERPVILG